MKEKNIKIETAKLLKLKGFDIECESGYHKDGELETYTFINDCNCDNKVEHQIVAPTQSLVQKWLRDIHDIDMIIYRSFAMFKSYHYIIIKNCDYDNVIEQCLTPDRMYEEALEDAIIESLQMLH